MSWENYFDGLAWDGSLWLGTTWLDGCAATHDLPSRPQVMETLELLEAAHRIARPICAEVRGILTGAPSHGPIWFSQDLLCRLSKWTEWPHEESEVVARRLVDLLFQLPFPRRFYDQRNYFVDLDGHSDYLDWRNHVVSNLWRCGPPPPWPLPSVNPDWLAWEHGIVPALAQQIHATQNWQEMGLLRDALMDAGCSSLPILNHCRLPGPHGACWVLRLLLQ
jgi:hypothetical protein